MRGQINQVSAGVGPTCLPCRCYGWMRCSPCFVRPDCAEIWRDRCGKCLLRLGGEQRPLRGGRGCEVAVLSAIYHYCLNSGRARLRLRPSDKGRARILEDWRSSHPVAAGMVECRESSVQILSKHAPQLFSTLPRTPSTAFPCQHQARHH